MEAAMRPTTAIDDHIFDFDYLLRAGTRFEHPRDVVSHPGLGLGEKRVILASWASDASAIANKVAIGRLVLTNREHIIALEPLEKGLVGTLLRYPYEVRNEQEYFDEIQNVKVTKDMLDLARHIVNQKAGTFDPGKFEDHYEAALVDLINQKRAGKT